MFDTKLSSMDRQYLLDFPIRAALEAGKVIFDIYESPEDLQVETKADDSPLTRADRAANTVINDHLKRTGIPIISEENRQIPYGERKGWDACWIVDPLDGTKEFIKRNGEFTVNIAYCRGGVPVFGVIYVPVSRTLYYNDPTLKRAYRTIMVEHHVISGALFREEDALKPAPAPQDAIKVVGSRSHMNPETEGYMEQMKEKYREVEVVSRGSSLKFCMVAEGRAHVYPRFAPTMEWDTAAGSAIVEAAGLRVTNRETGLPLRYNKENLLNPFFTVSR